MTAGQAVLRWLFPKVDAVFTSHFSKDESVARLSSCTHRRFAGMESSEAAIGSVSASRVKLHRVTVDSNGFVFANTFRPVFVGAFAEEDGRVRLRGQFTQFSTAKIFIAFGMVFLTAWIGVSTYGAASALLNGGDMRFLLLPLAGFGFGALFVGIVRGSWWLSKGDIPYLTALVKRALTGG